MARTFGALDNEPPKWFKTMSANPPACFAQDRWVLYLTSVRDESQGNASLRARLCRGQLPNYCAECTTKHRTAMKKAKRCHPHAAAQPMSRTRSKRALPLHRAVVALCQRTWALKAFSELRAVAEAGFSVKAVHTAIASGNPYRGRLWRWASQIDAQATPPKRTHASTSGASVFTALATSVTQTQLSLELGVRMED
jgi:hypothetical protein